LITITVHTLMSYEGPYNTLAPWSRPQQSDATSNRKLADTQSQQRWVKTIQMPVTRCTPYERMHEQYVSALNTVLMQSTEDKKVREQRDQLIAECNAFEAEKTKFKQQQLEFYAEVFKFTSEHRYDLELIKERRELDAMRAEIELERQLLAQQLRSKPLTVEV
jgi:hypothetical protein